MNYEQTDQDEESDEQNDTQITQNDVTGDQEIDQGTGHDEEARTRSGRRI